jgi:uncharacterized iron-regulated membrane protein
MRKLIVQVHLWLGLTIGLLWALQGLTGALFVFSREMDRITGPAAIAGPMTSLDRMVGTAVRETGGAKITRLSVADARHDLVNVLYTDGEGVDRALIIDGATAKAVGAREMEPVTPFTGSASRWLYVTHKELNAGRRGEVLIGLSGLVMITTVISGLWIAWPRRGAWKPLFQTSRWRKLEHRLFGWHRLTGLLVAGALLLLCVTGAYLNFSDAVRAAVARAFPFDAAQAEMSMRHDSGGLGNVTISPQAALDVARSRFPDAIWVRVFMPSAGEPYYTVRMRQPGELRAWIGVTTVAVDSATGEIVYTYDPNRAPLSNRILDAAYSIHNGEIAGLPGRILTMLAGLALPALYVTGLWAWQRRRTRRPPAARSRP